MYHSSSNGSGFLMIGLAVLWISFFVSMAGGKSEPSTSSVPPQMEAQVGSRTPHMLGDIQNEPVSAFEAAYNEIVYPPIMLQNVEPLPNPSVYAEKWYKTVLNPFKGVPVTPCSGNGVMLSGEQCASYMTNLETSIQSLEIALASQKAENVALQQALATLKEELATVKATKEEYQSALEGISKLIPNSIESKK